MCLDFQYRSYRSSLNYSHYLLKYRLEMIPSMRRVSITVMMFIITPPFISNFALGNVLGQDDESESYIYLVDSEPFGIPYYKWTESWWNWLVSTPTDSNPALDMDGKECQEGMHYKYPVLFLAGSLNETASRNCAVPSDVSIFFPATTSYCYNTLSVNRTEAQLRTCAALQKSDMNTEVNIDGSELNTFAYDITDARVQSNLFGIEVPEDNILGISAQNVSGIAAGDWVFLKPSVFSPGTHKISFTGNLNGTLSNVSYSLNITGSSK
jgi:hypothetical protein